MQADDNGQAVQREALLQVEPFLRWQLPSLLRRHRLWHGRDHCSRNDVLAELRQELRLDCVEHAATITDLDRTARHVRWFRLAERWLYRHRRAPHRRAVALAFDLPAQEVAEEPPDEPTLLTGLLPEAPDGVLERMVHVAVQHGNGRCNATGTAQRLGLPRGRLRQLWMLAAARAGYDGEYLCFWQRRLAEALTGLAADLLADAGGLVLLPRRRPRPDPRQRLARIRRIRTAMSVRPLPYDLRRLLALALRKATPTPGDLLAAAARLRPYEATIPLWQFEAATAGGDEVTAIRAVRRARRLGADAIATVLARARLLQQRGRDGAAWRLLVAARRRQRDDGRLALASTLAGGAADNAEPSNAASSRSAAGSGRAIDHDGRLSNQPSPR